MTGGHLLAKSDIHIGEHHTFNFIGMTFNADTIWSTVLAGVIVIILGLLVARSASLDQPGKLQLAWEALVTWVTQQVESNLGRVNPFVVPLAITLFAFIWIANLIEIVPTMDWAPSPTADVNLTFAMAVFVIVAVHIYSVRDRGPKGYVKHYVESSRGLNPVLRAILFFISVIEEIAKPITLALRLFGNLFSSAIMIALIAFMFPVWLLWLPTGVWKLFDFLLIAPIQAFIFALLTILYFGMAGATHPEDSDATEGEPQTEKPISVQPEPRDPQLQGAN